MLKWLGAAMIVAACGAWGFCAGLLLRRQEYELRELLNTLAYMSRELAYHQSPLPELMEAAGDHSRGVIASVMISAAQQLRLQQYPDAKGCVHYALSQHTPMTKTRQLLEMMGASIGKFDLTGQQEVWDQLKEECSRMLQDHCAELEQRIRTYRILGLCTGGTLAILLL